MMFIFVFVAIYRACGSGPHLDNHSDSMHDHHTPHFDVLYGRHNDYNHGRWNGFGHTYLEDRAPARHKCFVAEK